LALLCALFFEVKYDSRKIQLSFIDLREYHLKDLMKPILAELVIIEFPISSKSNQTCIFQLTQMMTHCRLRLPQGFANGRYVQFTLLREQIQNVQAVFIRDAFEELREFLKTRKNLGARTRRILAHRVITHADTPVRFQVTDSKWK